MRSFPLLHPLRIKIDITSHDNLPSVNVLTCGPEAYMWDPCSLSPSLVHPNLGLVRIGGIGLFLVFSGRNRLGRIEIWLEPLEPFVWAWTGCKPDPVQIFSSFHGLEQTLAQSPPDRILAVGHDAALAPQEVKRRRRRTTPTASLPTTFSPVRATLRKVPCIFYGCNSSFIHWCDTSALCVRSGRSNEPETRHEQLLVLQPIA